MRIQRYESNILAFSSKDALYLQHQTAILTTTLYNSRKSTGVYLCIVAESFSFILNQDLHILSFSSVFLPLRASLMNLPVSLYGSNSSSTLHTSSTFCTFSVSLIHFITKPNSHASTAVLPLQNVFPHPSLTRNSCLIFYFLFSNCPSLMCCIQYLC